MEFLIWSMEHDAWWRPGHMGYTRNVAEAGHYSDQESRDILKRANYPRRCNEARIPVECVADIVIGDDDIVNADEADITHDEDARRDERPK